MVISWHVLNPYSFRAICTKLRHLTVSWLEAQSVPSCGALLERVAMEGTRS